MVGKKHCVRGMLNHAICECWLWLSHLEHKASWLQPQLGQPNETRQETPKSAWGQVGKTKCELPAGQHCCHQMDGRGLAGITCHIVS
jgi:hypothetical protein